VDKAHFSSDRENLIRQAWILGIKRGVLNQREVAQHVRELAPSPIPSAASAFFEDPALG